MNQNINKSKTTQEVNSNINQAQNQSLMGKNPNQNILPHQGGMHSNQNVEYHADCPECISGNMQSNQGTYVSSTSTTMGVQNMGRVDVVQKEQVMPSQTLGYIPITTCGHCSGSGYSVGQYNEVSNIIPTKQISVESKTMTTTSNMSNLSNLSNSNLGFQPNQGCKDCLGTGYRVGSNNEICKVCSAGYSKSNTIGYNQNQNISSTQKLH